MAVNEIIFGGGSNFIPPGEYPQLTQADVDARIAGSKWVLASEEAMVMTIWTCKVCMLLIYQRLTYVIAVCSLLCSTPICGSIWKLIVSSAQLKQAKLINVVFIWVVLGFIATQLALFINCRPFSDYWSVPAISNQCWSYWNYAVVEAVCNISADIAVLLIALPILWKVRIPLCQRIILIGVFGLGTFVIAAAILTKVYVFDPALLSYDYLNWYFREASVSIYVTNLPVMWAILRDTFPSVAQWGYKTQKRSSVGYGSSARRPQQSATDYNMRSFNTVEQHSQLNSKESQESILRGDDEPDAQTIYVKKSYSIKINPAPKTTWKLQVRWIPVSSLGKLSIQNDGAIVTRVAECDGLERTGSLRGGNGLGFVGKLRFVERRMGDFHNH